MPATAPPKVFEADLAYAAGFFDGEGSVLVIKYLDTATHAFHRYNLRVNVTQQSQKPLEWFQQRWGGYIERHPTRVGFCSKWSTSGQNARMFLESICPYLQVKSQQVQYILSVGSIYTDEHRVQLIQIRREEKEAA